MQKEIQKTLSEDREASIVLAEPEHYKGIFYVRLSTLPIDQKSRIRTSAYRHSIIIILKDDSPLNDCMSYTDYVEWHTTQLAPGHLQHVESIHSELLNN